MNTGGIARGPFFIRLAQTTALSQNRRQVLPRFLNRKRLKWKLEATHIGPFHSLLHLAHNAGRGDT